MDRRMSREGYGVLFNVQSDSMEVELSLLRFDVSLVDYGK